MARKNQLVSAGIWGSTAAAVLGAVATGLTAAGSTQGTALALAAEVNVVGTTAASTGVLLPPSEAGDIVEVYNQGANALAVYPLTG